MEESLWPLLEALVGSHDVAGLAVAVVREGEVASRGFGVRDVGTGEPVTAETMFHLASVSKPVVATAIVSLAMAQDAGKPTLDLDAPIIEWVPEFTLADGRAGEITARQLLSHSSGLPDVSDYGWHDPQLGDDALSEFARSLSGWRLQADPGAAYSYSNAGYELLGLVLSRACGTTFEEAVRRQVLAPLGMPTSTFLRREVSADLAASPHVGMPLTVPDGAYPYTRRHAPSSTLHSNLVELCRWMQAHLEPAELRLDPALLDLMWRPVLPVGSPPWEEEAALGWFVGSHCGHRTLGHSGADPGFGSRLVLLPERRIGVVVLANSNTVPTFNIVAAALDIALGEESGEGVPALRRIAETEPAEFGHDDEESGKAVWGAIELHRTNLVWPLLRVWTALRPDSSDAWTMTGWAHQVDGHFDVATSSLRRALDLDPENDDAVQILRNLSPA